MEPDITTITYKAVELLQSLETTGQLTEVYFEPDDYYVDSWIRGVRKGGGFMGFGVPAATTPFHQVEIHVVARPGVLDPTWTGYTLVIVDANANPQVQSIIQLLESGGNKPAPTSLLPGLLPHVQSVLDLRVAPMQPIRQSPPSMF